MFSFADFERRVDAVNQNSDMPSCAAVVVLLLQAASGLEEVKPKKAIDYVAHRMREDGVHRRLDYLTTELYELCALIAFACIGPGVC